MENSLIGVQPSEPEQYSLFQHLLACRNQNDRKGLPGLKRTVHVQQFRM